MQLPEGVDATGLRVKSFATINQHNIWLMAGDNGYFVGGNLSVVFIQAPWGTTYKHTWPMPSLWSKIVRLQL